MKHTVNIFGEMHTKSDRDRVEKEIIDLFRQGKVKYLLSEEIGDNVAMTSDAAKRLMKGNNSSISNRSYELGIKLGIPVIGIDNWNEKTYRLDKKNSDGSYVNCTHSFSIREKTMVSVIEKYGNLGPCAVIVGDSHLRYQPNTIMGDVSPIIKRYLSTDNVFIYRSPISELEENNIVIVKGTEFNKNVFNKLIKMGNELVLEEKQFQDTRFQKRIDEGNIPYDLDDFIFPNKETFCYIEDNEIRSMMVVFKSTDKLIILGPGYTDKENRGKGMMTKLFEEIFKRYPKTKYGFSIGVLYENLGAIKLYKKLGFKPTHLNMILAK